VKKTRLRLFLEITTVVMLGYVLYANLFPSPESTPTDSDEQLSGEKASSGRMSNFIKNNTIADKAGEKPNKNPGNPTDTFKPEPTATKSIIPAETIEVISAPTILTGEVTDSRGQLILQPTIIFSTDCRFTAPVENGLFAIEVEPGICTLQARRQEGEYILESAPVRIDILASRTNEVQLLLPDLQYGTIGIEVVMHADIAEVSAVLQNSSAAAAGMLPGHFIMEVNGLAVAGMNQDDFHNQLSGPVGTQAQIVIVGEAEDGTIQEIPLALERTPTR